MSIYPKLFRSSDTGAPSLSGTAGALIALLDACLINGYQTKSVSSLTRSGTTATATTATAHGYSVDDVILNAGADQGDYNGEFRITAVTTTTYTFELANSPTTPATGTITSKRAPAGWTKPYSGTNLAAYKGAAGNNYLLRVDDTGSLTAQGARNAFVRGFETMSDPNTGTNPFQTVAQSALGLNWRKSTSADATARPWMLVASDRFVHLIVGWDTIAFSTSNPGAVYYFGDLDSPVKPSDTTHCIIGGHTADVPSAIYANINTAMGSHPYCAIAAGTTTNAGFIAKRANGINTSALSYLIAVVPGWRSAQNPMTGHVFGSGNNGNSGFAQLPYPCAVDNGLHLAAIDVWDQDGPRGILPLVYEPRHYLPLLNGEIVAGVPTLPGQKLLAQMVAGTSLEGTPPNPSSTAGSSGTKGELLFRFV
jgi:hypothetical protein